MAIKEIEGFDYETIDKKLSKEGKAGRCLRTIVEFIFSDVIKDLTDELNDVFSSDLGNKAYPREMIIGVLLYCSHLHKCNLSDVAHETEVNNLLRIFTCGNSFSASLLREFFISSDKLVLKKIFLSSLVVLNDLDLLNFLRVFVDSTDALVNGSKYYKITRDELKALKLVKEWGLLHKNTPQSIEKFKKKILLKKSMFKGNKEVMELIVLILGRLKFYNRNNGGKIEEFECCFELTEKDFISVSFPSAVMMPTKKGGYDFAFILQTMMTENNIIIGSLLMNKPNDNLAINEIITELKENFTLLLELIEEYGQRRNYKQIKKILEKAIFIFDSGYFSDENLESLAQHEINGLVMSKTISRVKNNEIRSKNNLPTKEKDNKQEKFTKEDFKRVHNGYECKQGHKLELVSVKPINSAKNKREGIADSWKEQRYIHECKACTKCPIRDQCLDNEDSKIIIDRVSTLKYEMINKFTIKRYDDMYGERFQISEGINGYFKNTDGILHLFGSNKNAVKNQIHLINTMYNLTRTKNLKGTAY